MKNIPLLLITAAVALSACDRRPSNDTDTKETPVRTAETAGVASAIDTYARTPNAQTAAAVDQAFAALDGEIAELQRMSNSVEGKGEAEANEKLEFLRAYRREQQVRYAEARTRAGVESLGDAVRSAGESVKDGVREAADTVRDAVR